MISGVALGVVPSLWPALIRPHPYMVGALFVIGILMMAAPLFSKDAVDTPQVRGLITVGSDNSGHQIISNGNIYLSHTATSPLIGENSKLQNIATSAVVKPVLGLKLIPHGDNDSSVYLEVVNQGDAINISAQLRIVGLSPGRPFKTYPFNGQWKSELAPVDFYNQQSESYVESVRLEPNISRLLKIASIASFAYGQQEMELLGIDEELVKWDINPRQNQELPYFIIQITLVAKGYSEAVNVTYKVGPKTTLGPFQMMEVTV